MTKVLEGKTALVTGGGRGIGAAISQALAEAGCNVLVHGSRLSETLVAFARRLAESHGVRTGVAFGDFRDSHGVAPVFDALDVFSERLDILVNNAGFETTFAAEDMPLGAWSDVFAVNLQAPFLCSQQAAQRMKRIGGGVIVNKTSIHAATPRKGLSHYCAAKAALSMFGHCAAIEWAEYGIRVVNIGPGAIKTDMNREAIEALGRGNFDRWIPAGRVGTTDDVAGLVCFVCSDAAGYITGTDIYVDGGYLENLVRYDDRPRRAGKGNNDD